MGKCSIKGNSAFTLIELLVVVLIIGILAAVALPQYQFAVEKARLAPKLSLIADTQKALDMYVLEKGYPSVGYVDLAAEPHDESFNIDLNHSFDACNDWSCYDKFFSYSAYCGDGVCEIWLDRCANTESSCGEDWPYDLNAIKSPIVNDNWSFGCYPHNSIGERICASLEKQGWQLNLNSGDLYPNLDPEPDPNPGTGSSGNTGKPCSTVADCSCSYAELGFVATFAVCEEGMCFCGGGGSTYPNPPNPKPDPDPVDCNQYEGGCPELGSGNEGSSCSSDSDCFCPNDGTKPYCIEDEMTTGPYCVCWGAA